MYSEEDLLAKNKIFFFPEEDLLLGQEEDLLRGQGEDVRSFKKGWVLRLNGGKDATLRVVNVCFDPLGTTFYSLKYKNDTKQ